MLATANQRPNGLKPHTESGFISIGKGIYLSRPKDGVALNVEKENVPPPTIILIFGWMGAKLTHLYKYTKVYDELFPNTTKVLIRCEPVYFWSSEKTNRARVAPVVEVLRRLGCIPSAARTTIENGDAVEPLVINETPRVLMHAFSNGGCLQLTTLSALISASPSPPLSLALPSALIIDSAPGSGGVHVTQRAFSCAIHNPIIRYIAIAFIAFMYLYLYISRLFSSRLHMLDRMHELLLNHAMFPWTHKATRRLYMYSDGDDLVPAVEVEEHMSNAVKTGWVVSCERFGSSMHVAHARLDPARYWSAVEEVWEEAVRAVREKSYNGPA
ncbi:hypothetical protein BDQ12DRAFT_691088 [Crucibulum laeve]|uniref:Indole-diterpene biosynthesis protein PaxU n=1 Tax=Crucibulum laeve TaxID=68775 RepID=A0A5C3LL50_9AGAR|nr:hypothetical protein BDQ12DRAFT_691088 [Crucibulum laeve]